LPLPLHLVLMSRHSVGGLFTTVSWALLRSLGALLRLSVYHLLNCALLVLLGVALAHGVHDVELWQRGAFVGTCVTAPLSLKEHALRNCSEMHSSPTPPPCEHSCHPHQ
jgi:hypothetical protein